jgi:hypothetical protein
MLLCSCVLRFLLGFNTAKLGMSIWRVWLKSVNNMHLTHVDILLERSTKMKERIMRV